MYVVPRVSFLCFKMALKLARVGMAGNIQRHFGIPYLGLGIAITVAIAIIYAVADKCHSSAFHSALLLSTFHHDLFSTV